MAWTDFPDARQSIGLLRRSLERGRLGHAYLFSGDTPEVLERIARELAATVNCTAPTEVSETGLPLAACQHCSSCRRIAEQIHPDVHWLRAESKLRVVRIEQVRELIQSIQLKPTEAAYKVGIIVGADRLNPNAANAFLKTLEEPPSRSLLILLSTEPERLLETILSRCLRLVFPGVHTPPEDQTQWIRSFAADTRTPPASFLARYQLLDRLLRHLEAQKKAAESTVEARSPARQYKDIDPSLRDQWEEEAKAAVEAEYRLRRGQTLQLLQWWLRDVWLLTLGQPTSLLALPELAEDSEALARRLTDTRAAANLRLLEETQALLHTNVQEALALEVALLRLDF